MGFPLVNINELLGTYRSDIEKVEAEILGHLNSEIPLINELGKYILDAGGKRLRPVLAVLSARLFGAPGDAIYKAAGALEFLHTATLLHDDVVDEADTRRARKAARQLWGNPASVLVGDYLLATAFRSLTLLGNLHVLETISEATGKMAKGEILQLLRSYDTASEQDYLDIIINKTACLFAAAAKIGGLFGGASPAQQEALYAFGNDLGIAFQIVDDALDYVEDRSKIGKPLGIDLKEKKVTLPLSRLVHVARGAELEKLQAILRRDAVSDDDVLEVMRMMQAHDVLPYTLAEARKIVRRGQAHLTALPNAIEREHMRQLADYVVEREF
ncbi:MAG: polyprenyl synthetase family protein [Candidatus Lambdaproteobacteria bacterium]|nr:polyprenyl synthetase family protein [Candidatus Lambdaproteobacteria bacterium]